MKTAVSLPDDVYESVERLRKLTKRQRSEVYADALREYVARHSDDETEIDEDPSEKAFRQAAAHQVLSRVEW
jgi:metal-responsive CopG/Arc/MetJ family transcriptional regulator